MTRAFDGQIERIVAKLENGGLSTGSRLDASEVEAFEKLWKVHFPEAYRQFLLRVGNGGAGPYTFLPLHKWSEHLNLLGSHIPSDYLSVPSGLGQRSEAFHARNSRVRF